MGQTLERRSGLQPEDGGVLLRGSQGLPKIKEINANAFLATNSWSRDDYTINPYCWQT
jgi:hypothetical protein